MRNGKRVMKIIFIAVAAMLLLLLVIYVNHQIHLKEKAELRLPYCEYKAISESIIVFLEEYHL